MCWSTSSCCSFLASFAFILWRVLDIFCFSLVAFSMVVSMYMFPLNASVNCRLRPHGRHSEVVYPIPGLRECSSGRLPVVIEFNHETAQKIFKGLVKSHALFFLSKKADDYETQYKMIHAMAPEYKDKVMFVMKLHQRLFHLE